MFMTAHSSHRRIPLLVAAFALALAIGIGIVLL